MNKREKAVKLAIAYGMIPERFAELAGISEALARKLFEDAKKKDKKDNGSKR